jgi:transposase
VLVLPALIGLFWGAPLITRELEAGTHRLVWNQTITRTRWLAVKLGLTGLATITAAGLGSLAVTWWSSPIDKTATNDFPRMGPLLFDARGVVPIGYAAFAFALGVTVGMLVRRTLPAMAITRHPEVVLEATYAWYWAVDALRAAGASVHLAHPLGVKAFAYRRVKNDVRDAADLADLLRMGRLSEAWVAPPATRELRELVRHRAKLVALRSHCKAEVHAVLAKCGVQVLMSDLFGLAGTALLDGLDLPAPYAARICSLRRVMDLVDFEIGVFAGLIRARLAHDPAYTAVQTIPGIGATLGAVMSPRSATSPGSPPRRS